MAFEIIFKVINQVNSLVKQFLISTAVHKQCLCAEHLRHFGENGCASLGDEQI